MENLERGASLEDLVRRMFDGPGGEELPAYEKKRFFLTRPDLERHHEKLVETMAAIANGGYQTGLILCSGNNEPDQLVDPEQLDAKMRAVVGPAVRFTLSRVVVAERTVDLIAIPRSLLRPHIVRDRNSNRFYLPLRGAANNATAARHDLDEMIQDQLLDTLRRAFPSMVVDARDATLRYAQEIGYGLDANSGAAAIATLVVPEPIQERLSSSLLQDEMVTNRRLFNLTNQTVNSGFSDYYTTAGILSTRYGEDYCEMFEASVRGEQQATLWANRIYLTGAIARRSVLWQVGLHGAWTIEWFVKEVEATLKYASLAFDELNPTNVEQVRILTVLRGVANQPLAAQKAFEREAIQSRGFDDLLVLPTRSSMIVPRHELSAQAKQLAAELGRIVRTLYQQ